MIFMPNWFQGPLVANDSSSRTCTPLWRESLLRALDQATKAVEHLCQLTQSAALFSASYASKSGATEWADPAQLSVEPLAEDRTQQELQRLALKAHQEARQAADLRHDMAKRIMPSDGPYKPGDKVFVWSAPANANSIASKALRKERWIRGTVIS